MLVFAEKFENVEGLGELTVIEARRTAERRLKRNCNSATTALAIVRKFRPYTLKRSVEDLADGQRSQHRHSRRRSAHHFNPIGRLERALEIPDSGRQAK